MVRKNVKQCFSFLSIEYVLIKDANNTVVLKAKPINPLSYSTHVPTHSFSKLLSSLFCILPKDEVVEEDSSGIDAGWVSEETDWMPQD